MRSGIPPWHMWGNSQRIEGIVQDTVGDRPPTNGQMVRINYGRPESWHWMLSAKLLEGPDAGAGDTLQISVDFDLITGIGRSAIDIRQQPLTSQTAFKTFESYTFAWGPAALIFPAGAMIWTTQVLAPNRNYRNDPPFPNYDGVPVPGAFITTPSIIDHIVAQDIQLNVRVLATAVPPGSVAVGQPFAVEVSAQFAPFVHTRPEWHKGGRFPGAEDGGGEEGTVAGQMRKLSEDKAAPGSDADPRDQALAISDPEAEWQAYVDSLTDEQYEALMREQFSDEVARRSADPPVRRLRHNPRRLG